MKLTVLLGTADMMCNAYGNFNWMLALENPFSLEFRNATTKDWHLPSSSATGSSTSGKKVGDFRAAYGDAKSGAGSYVFVDVDEAGHMVPYDQPEAALDLIGRWLKDISFD